MIKNLHKTVTRKTSDQGLDSAEKGWLCKQEESVLGQFAFVIEGHGKLEGKYTIKLHNNAKPFSVSTPRRVPIPLLEPVRK